MTILGTGDRPTQTLSEWEVDAIAFQRYGPSSLHFAPELRDWLKSQSRRWDLVSMQGVWLHTNCVLADWCIEHKRPFMITVHGNFNPIALRVSAWKKYLASLTFMRKVLRHVACYQASTEIEYRALRNYGIRQPICVIPNGIDLPDMYPGYHELLPRELRGRRTCLYLGRLHPIKGIDRLLRAWGRVNPGNDWQLIIAGDGTSAYRVELEHAAQIAGCHNVHFTGFIPAEIKGAWFREADFCVLPSHSEAFAMAPMEAFSYRKPVLLTTGCGFPEAAQAGAALEVESTEDGLSDGLAQMLAFKPSELELMGARALAFVCERYHWAVICGKLESVYTWMRDGGDPPECVRLG